MTTTDFRQIQPGWEVYDSEGEHIGSISEVADSFVTLTKGLFLPKDYYIPQQSILRAEADKNQVWIDCAKSDLDRMGFDSPPVAESSDLGTSAGYDRSGRDLRTERDLPAGETQRVPRYEEELRAEKTSRQAGEVQVTKDVEQERQGFDVPVTREEVEVRRVAVNRPASGSDEAFQDGETLRVPVRAEQVEVTKEPRVVEEIEVRRTPRQETQRVEDTVRREKVDVQRSGDVDVRDSDRELAGAGAGADRMQRTDLDAEHDFESAGGDRTGGTDFDEQVDGGADRSRW